MFENHDKIWPMLYGKDSKGKIRTWLIATQGNLIGMLHGLKDGKMTFKTVEAKGKNAGKANATTDAQQAVLEAEAKWVKQKKTGYFLTEEEAMAFEPFTPMKAQSYNDHAIKIKYPCIMQPKLNGQRLMIDSKGNAWSKQGEPLELPEHWKSGPYLSVSAIAKNLLGADGEVYAGLESKGGLSLQRIISAFRKPNEDTLKLKYYIYDIPTNVIQWKRFNELKGWNLKEEGDGPIVMVPGVYVETEEQGNQLYMKWVTEGYEGAVYRNLDGEYEFGKRSYNLIKRKPRMDLEATVISVEIDRNGDGILLCQILEGEYKGNSFKCLMKKDSDSEINYRKYENAIKLVDKIITVEFEEFSDEGVCTKPVGIGIRALSDSGKFL